MRSWLRRPMFRVIVLVAVAAVATTARSKPEMAPDGVSLTGQLLIASTEIGDPRFDRAVILLVRHDKHGALGIVINRPVGEEPLASILRALGEDATGVEGSVRLFAGGPVDLATGFVLHSTDY